MNAAPWITHLPAGWDLLPIKYASTRIQTGTTPPTAEEHYFQDGSIPWFGPSSIGRALEVSSPVKQLHESAITDGKARIFARGTSLVVTIGATLGRAAMLPLDGSANQQITAITFQSDRVLSRFGAYHMKALEDHIRGMALYTTLPIMDQEQLGSMPLVAPPLTKQEAIVNFLDGKTAVVDDLIAKKERLIGLIAEMRQTLITERTTACDSSDWNATRLGHVIREIQRPVTVVPEQSYAEIGIRSHGRGIFHKEPVFGWQLDEKKVFWIKPGDLVFNIVFAWERAVAVVGEAEVGMIGSHRFPTFRPIANSADVRFLRYLFISDLGRFLLDQNSPGAAGRNRTLDRNGLLKEVIRLPSIANQIRIGKLLDQQTRQLDSAQLLLGSQLEKLHEYRQTLITAAVTGELQVS